MTTTNSTENENMFNFNKESTNDEEDINQILRYFSYEHFYTLYVKFWEIDNIICSRKKSL